MVQKHQTVMLIDDETQWLDLIQQALSEESYSVVTASSGESALKKMHRKKPDLIVSDVRMPVINGFDLFEKVKNDPKLKGIPYVFMSSIDDYDAMRTAREIGADDYFEKPFDAESVKAIVLDLLVRFQDRNIDYRRPH
ncbi:MAG TPA: response regulator [Bacteroidota bacterium]|nr:response regulator [Bacteroidota bacterium]